MPDMPDFVDQNDPEIVWVWDSEAKDYAPKRRNNQPERSWSSGGDNDLFDPAVHTYKPKNPLMEGFMASADPKTIKMYEDSLAMLERQLAIAERRKPRDVSGSSVAENEAAKERARKKVEDMKAKLEQARTAASGIQWPVCPNCGERAGLKPYEFARGYLQCAACQHLDTPENWGKRLNDEKAVYDAGVGMLPEAELPKGHPERLASGDEQGYNGWTNWDTWHAKLLIDNEQGSNEEARRIVREGLQSGQNMQQVEQQLADWARQTIIGPSNNQAMKDAQEWNDIPIEERTDPHYDEFVGQHPEAQGLVDGIFGGPDVSDVDPMVMDDMKINWYEIAHSILEDEIGEWQYEQGHDWRSEERPEWAPSPTLTLPDTWAKVAASWRGQEACNCGVKREVHEWNPSWGCPADGPVNDVNPPAQNYSDGPFPNRVPRENTVHRDPSFPSMNLTSARVTSDMSVRDDLADQYRRQYLGADLSSCPDCATPMRESAGEMTCSGCGNRQPILNLSKTADFGDMGQGMPDEQNRDEAYEATTCPACGGPGVYLGNLGRLAHFRCRNCGMGFSDEGGMGEPRDALQNDPNGWTGASVKEAAVAALPMIGRLMGGALGRGALQGGAMSMMGGPPGMGGMPGMPGGGTPEEQGIPMLPVQSVASYGMESFGLGSGQAPAVGGGMPPEGSNVQAAAEEYRQMRLQGKPAGEAMQQIAALHFNGDVAAAQAAVGANVRLTGSVDRALSPAELLARYAASDEDDDVGGSTKNRGDDDNPEHKTQGFMEEHGDQPELLKDVELVGDASREGEDSGLVGGDPDEAMKAFHANLPLVIEFADSEESGADHPVLKALDELLESVFPGYKGSTDEPDKGEADEAPSDEHETKEAASFGWSGPDMNAGLQPQQPMGQPGVVSVQDPCPVCGAGPGVPCAHKMDTGGQPNQAAPGIPGVQGIPSQVPAVNQTMANVDETFNKHSARKPKMCPYHRDLVDYALELGDPTAALSAVQPVGYGNAYCKSGEYGDRCNFRAPMVTQAYWDAKDAEYAERAEQRALEAEQAAQPMTQPAEVDVQPEPEVEYQVPEPQMNGVFKTPAPEDDGEGASLEGAPSAVGEGIPAFSRFDPVIAHRSASRRWGKVSMFEMLSDEDMTGDLPAGPQHILADKDDGNLPHGEDFKGNDSNAHEKHDMPEHHHPEAEHPVSESNRSNHPLVDSEGMPLQEGEDYLMKSPNYEIPDKITVDSIDGNQVTYTVKTDLSEYTDTIGLDEIAADQLSFINDTNKDSVTDSSEETWDTEAPPRPDSVGGPGEVTDLSQPSTAVSKVVEATGKCAECGHLHYEGDGEYSDCPVCDCKGQDEKGQPADKYEYAERNLRGGSADHPVSTAVSKIVEAVSEYIPEDRRDEFAAEVEKLAGGADHLKEFQFKKKDDSVGEGSVDEESDESADEESDDESHEASVAPLDRAAAMANPELIATAGTEYVAKFEGDEPSDRDWIMGGGDGQGVDVDPHLAAKLAGKAFTPREQREFIDEKGSARNLDKLDLANTHYIEDADFDDEFLFGARG